jgi:hypothetical protein
MFAIAKSGSAAAASASAQFNFAVADLARDWFGLGKTPKSGDFGYCQPAETGAIEKFMLAHLPDEKLKEG